MARVARPAFLTGTFLLVAGLLWVALIFKGWSDLWPTVLHKPFTASAVAVLGVILIRLARGLHAQRQDEDPFEEPAPRRTLSPRDFADMLPKPAALRRVEPQDPEPAPPAASPEPLPRKVIAEPDEDALGPVAVAMAAFERMQKEAQHQRSAAQVRTAFRIAEPGRETRSWVGGAPMMPDHMPWPVLRGAPGVFLAQIDLAELPKDIWGGIGPREGDLLFFAAKDPAQDICAIHLPQRGRVRQIPSDTPHFYKLKAPERRLEDLIGPQVLQAPRWALEARPDRGQVRSRPGVARASFCTSARLDDPALYPFDWPMVFALLDSLGAALRRELKTLEGGAGRMSKSERDARLVSLAKLRLLAKQTEARAEDTVFDEDEADDFLSALAELTNEGWSGKAAPQSLMSLPMFRGYRGLLETYARYLMAKSPRSLPKSLQRSLMPVWQQETEHPFVTLGGMEGGDAVLARFYPSAMVGWQYAWDRPLTLVLNREALEHGDFDEAELRGQARSTRTEPTE